jgi:hypothetical protein
LSELSSDLLSSDNSLWTKDAVSSITPTVTSFDSEEHVQVITVDELAVVFNGSFLGETYNNSVVQITTGKFAQLGQVGNAAIMNYQEGPPFVVTDIINSSSGFYYGSHNYYGINYFTTASIVPLELDDTGAVKTWRLDIYRDYGDGDELAVQILVRLTKQDGYTQMSVSYKQSAAEISYQNYYDGDGYSYCDIAMSHIASQTASDWDSEVFHSSYSIESIKASGGVLPQFSYDDDEGVNYIYWWSSDFYATSGADNLHDITGFTFNARFPDRMVEATVDTAVVAAAAAASDETKKLIFGFDTTTLLFILGIIIIVIVMVMFVPRMSWSWFRKKSPTAASQIDTSPGLVMPAL